MTDAYALLSAEIDNWPSKQQLVGILKSNGFSVIEGQYSIRLSGFQNFEFRELGDDLGGGCITADHRSTEALVDFSKRVSEALAKAGVRHRFEIYSETEDLAAYVHHDWPMDR